MFIAQPSGAISYHCLAQGHFSMWTGQAGNQTTDPLISVRPTLSPEPQAPAAECCFLFTIKHQILRWHQNQLQHKHLLPAFDACTSVTAQSVPIH